MNKSKVINLPNAIIESTKTEVWTALEVKMFIVLVDMVNPTLFVTDKLYRIKISFSSIIEQTKCSPSSAYRDIHKATALLSKRKSMFNNGDIYITWFPTITINQETKIWEVSINPDFIEYLFDLKKYAKIELETILKLSNSYAMNLYMLNKSYIHWCNKYKKPFSKSIEEIKNFLGLLNKYEKQFHKFKNKVIEKSIKEINDKSEITVEYNFIKNGRSYESIEFLSHIKNKSVIVNDENKNISQEIKTNKNICIDGLLSFGFNEETARKLHNDTSNESIVYAVSKAKENSKDINSYAGWITHVAKEFYYNTTSSDKLKLEKIAFENKWRDLEKFCEVNIKDIEALYNTEKANNDKHFGIIDYLERTLPDIHCQKNYTQSRPIRTLYVNGQSYGLEFLISIIERNRD
jgi:plasmid replication initiation protein